MGFSAAHYKAAGDAILGKAAFSVALPTSFLCAAFDGDPGYDGTGANEPADGVNGYSRKAVPLASVDAGAGAGPVTWALNLDIEFDAGTGLWLAGANLTHFALFDQAGVLRLTGQITSPVAGKSIDNLDTLIIQAGTIMSMA